MANIYDEIVKKAAQRQGVNNSSRVSNISANREAAKAKLAEYIANPTDFDAIKDYKKITTPTLAANNRMPNLLDGRLKAPSVDMLSTPLERGEVVPKTAPLVNVPEGKIAVNQKAYNLAAEELKAKEQADKAAKEAELIARIQADKGKLKSQAVENAIAKGNETFKTGNRTQSFKTFQSDFAKSVEENKRYNRTYLETINEERKKAGLSHLNDDALQNYISLLEENAVLATDDAYTKNQKMDNLKSVKLTYGAILSDDFSSASQKGAKKNSDLLSGSGIKEIHNIINGNKELADGSSNRVYSMLEDIEKQVWNYYIGSGHSKKALEYINSMMPVLEDRLARQRAAEFDEQGAWGDIKEGTQAILGGLESGTKNMFNSILGTANAFGYELSPLQARGFKPSYSEQLTNYVLSDESGNNGFVKNIIYKALNSMSYQVPSLLITAAGGGMAAFTAQGIGANTTEGIRNGNNSIANVVYGVYEGAMEYAVDKLLGGVSSQIAGKGASGLTGKLLNKIDNVIKTPKINKLLSKATITVSTMGSEYLEEFLQTITEPAARGIIYGETMDYSWDTVWNALEAGLIGAISGGLMGVTQINRIKTQHDFETFGKNLLDTGKVDSIVKFAEDFGATDSSAYESVKSAMENKNDIEPTDIAQLYIEAKQSFNTFSEADAAKFIQKTANDVDVDTLSNVLFDGNTEAATKFIEKYSNMDIAEASENQGSAFNTVKEFDKLGKISTLSAANKKVDPVQKSINAVTGYTELSNDQQALKKMGEQFGAKVRFKNLTTKKIDADGNEVVFSPEGTYDPDTNTITLNTDARPEHRPALFILKHELSHSLETDKESFVMFESEVFKSEAFEQYMRKRGFDSLNAWQQDVINRYEEQGINFEGNKRVGANKEIVADFVADILFTSDTKTTEQFLKGLSLESQKGFIEVVKRFFAKLKAFFVGDAKLTEIERLEKQFLEVANKVAKMNEAETEQQKTTTEEGGGVEYNLSDLPTVELSNNNDLSELIEKSSDNRHNVIKNYIFNLFGNKEVVLSDGRTAIVDKSDAKHIAFRAEPKNIAEVSKIEEIIKKAVLMAEENSVVHPKFTYFAYYGVKVNYDGESFLLFLNVGEAKNDKKLHIYDITDRSKKRDVANRNNGFARPVGNALTNNISKHSIPNSPESVNKKLSLPETDSQGNTLTENQREFFNDTKSVDDNGNLMVMYQGSQEEFYEFDRKKSSPFNLYGRGFYFTNSKTHANQYGNVTRQYYLNIKNPISTYEGDNVITKEQLKKYLEVVVKNEDYSFENYGYNATVDSVVDSIYGKSDFAMIQDINATAIGDLVEAIELFNQVNGTSYDGIILNTETIIFNSNQAKLTTNENPSKSNDIRYSLPKNPTPLEIGDAYKHGEITAEEYEQRISELNRGKSKTLNPYEIANLPKDAADTTPELPKPKRKGKGDGESKLYQSFLDSEVVIPELKTEIENDTFIKNYGPTTNKRTLKMAVAELEEGGKARVEEFRTMQPEKASAVDVAVGLILLERYQRANDIEGALVIAEKLREIATVSGQTVQIFSIVGRFTPEMMAAYAQRDLDKAFEVLAEKKSQKWADKNANKYKLTEKEKAFIVNNTVLASQLEDGSRTKAILLAEICTLIENKIPSEMGDKLRALQRVSLLLNLKTQLRNILGNGSMIPTYIASDFFGSLIDKGLSKKTGVRTVGNFQLKGSGKAFGKGMYETYDDFKRGIHTKQQELNRYNNSIKGGKAFNEDHRLKALNYVAKFCNGLDNFTSFCLELGDRPFFEMWFNNSLNNQMRLNNVDIPTPEMLEIAKQEALQRTWQDDNAVTRAVQSVKKSLNMLHIPGTSYGLGDFVLKFTKTPANIAKAMVELSPVGLAISIGKAHNFRNALQKGTFTSAMQKELVRSVSSAITGTMIYTIIAIAASLGWVELSGEGDEDKKVSAFEKYIVGIPPYSMKIFGQNVTYDWNQPLGTVLATVADFMDSKNDDTDSVWYNDLLSAIKTGGAVFTKQSFLTGLYEFFSQEDFVTGIISSLVSEPSAYIPQISSQIASLIDPYRRTTYDPQDSFKTAINGVINKIPRLRQTLPAQVNVLGEESKNVQYLNPWQAFASPGNKYPESSGKVAEEIYKLYQETGTSEVLPKKAANKITVKGNTITFTVEETAEIQKKIGKTSVELLEKVFDSSDFKNLDEELKIKVVKKVYEYASQNMKTTLDYDYETISEIMGGQDVLTQEKYKKLGKQGVQVILNEYFLSKAERKCKGDPEKLVELFIKQTIKNSK